jgi:hypothetical protein
MPWQRLARRRTNALIIWRLVHVQIKLSWQAAMVKALRRWLEANELFAIITAVAGTLLVLSMLLVLGGYLFVTR